VRLSTSASDSADVESSTLDPHRENPTNLRLAGDVIHEPTEPNTDNTYKNQVGKKKTKPKEYISVTFTRARGDLPMEIHLNYAKWATLLVLGENRDQCRVSVSQLVPRIFPRVADASLTLGKLIDWGLIRWLDIKDEQGRKFVMVTDRGLSVIHQIKRAGGIVPPAAIAS
jgi:hypothetical protein